MDLFHTSSFFQIRLLIFLVRSGTADFSGCEGETMQKSCPVPERDVFVLSLHPIRVPCSELLRGRPGQSITREDRLHEDACHSCWKGVWDVWRATSQLINTLRSIYTHHQNRPLWLKWLSLFIDSLLLDIFTRRDSVGEAALFKVLQCLFWESN